MQNAALLSFTIPVCRRVRLDGNMQPDVGQDLIQHQGKGIRIYVLKTLDRISAFRILALKTDKGQSMKICVLNGSPKIKENSVTMHYLMYLQKKLPEASFHILNVANMVNRLEQDPGAYQEVMSSISNSDGIIWGFPLYYLLVSSQMKRFIELVAERKSEPAFHAKPAAAITTSIHFCDNYALKYIREVSEDLGMKFFDAYSAGMYDLNNAQERDRLEAFARNFLDFVKQGSAVPPQTLPLVYRPIELDLSSKPAANRPTGKKAVIITDEREEDRNLRAMTAYLKSAFGDQADVVNLRSIKINGGCLGCLHCGYDFTCVYDGKDEYRSVFEARISPADMIILAGSIHDRFFSAKWKQFFDRSFFHNHIPMLEGKQVGIVISGPLRQMGNLRMLLQNYFEVQKANLVDMVSDDYPEVEPVLAGLRNLADRMRSLAEQNYRAPQTFLGIAGHKVFRDAIFGGLRFPFVRDYLHYKKSGGFDFPHRNWKNIFLSGIMMLLTRIPNMREEIYTKRLISGMTNPLKKIVEQEKALDE